MPGTRPYQPLDDDGDIDDALAWVSILALFDEMTVVERLDFLYNAALWVCDLRTMRLEHLEFGQETVRRAMALEIVVPDEREPRQWQVVDADDGVRIIG